MIPALRQPPSLEVTFPVDPGGVRVIVDLRCDRCAGRMADCLMCGNRGRPAEFLLDREFDGA